MGIHRDQVSDAYPATSTLGPQALDSLHETRTGYSTAVAQ